MHYHHPARNLVELGRGAFGAHQFCVACYRTLTALQLFTLHMYSEVLGQDTSIVTAATRTTGVKQFEPSWPTSFLHFWC